MAEAAFLARRCVAVVGASTDRSKFGNRILRALLKTRDPATVFPGAAAGGDSRRYNRDE